MSLHVGAKDLVEVSAQILRWFEQDHHTEIVVTKNEEGEFDIIFD